ncbi:uncharacterized protein BT62DRAFT_968061 [Guyanagaster necrorhizus]|uniref:Uncharacterized protein n=1 Tax=Guyanagaster necrorhizus TaxID=856835 RepID=A0A9P8ASH6_9AGAR|nr:uncharacterized protein BT62DRAFT_968061 [Guyanagaster necrorhizus MCA 3950]KAG7446329.1 hypothetical protein BT62DRAFT_968061 [Guyanagaster necrorhizus MCA 3950]
MPPKPKSAKGTNAKPSASRDLISLGSRHLTGKRGKRDDDALSKERPTTTRALVLRNGKNGARGTGEVMLVSRLTGREKLDLLAEDLVQRSKQAVMAPFRLETCLKIAESQFSSYLDDITSLKDPDLFHSIIEAELKARTLTSKNPEEMTRDPAFIASTIAIRIHNAYLLTSAWKIVADNLFDLQLTGVSDDTVVYKLQDEEFRSQYLVLYDMVNVIMTLCQHKFAVLAATSPHYARYFKEKEGTSELEFDRAGLKDACRSFLDSIIIELCFPRAPYPKAILYQILHDAVEEAPKEAKRFPQSMWDSVGDLSEIVRLQDMLEAPLLGPNEKTWKSTNRTMPKAYQQWANAEIMSDKASDKWNTLEPLVHPLSKLQNTTALRNMWMQIQQNYMLVCNKDPDGIWGLTDALLKSTPSWHSFLLPNILEESDEESDRMLKLTDKKKKVLAITDGANSDDSMPPLQDVSESDESDTDWSETDEDDDDDEEDDESDYDTDEEDEIREMMREAMDTAVEADFFADGPESENLFNQEDRKGNPFLRLLGSLRGRMFNNSPKLSSRAKPTTKAASKSKGTTRIPTPTAKAPNQKTTMEEVEDEDDVRQGAGSKKKKKKPKKKKPAATESASPKLPTAPAPAPVPSAPPPPAAKQKPHPPPTKLRPNPVASSVYMSTTSIPPVEPTMAQSGHSYAQNMGVKTKVKSRSDQPSLFAKGVLGRLGVGREKSKQEPESKSTRRNWFASMHRKTKDYLHQILNTSEDVTKGSAGMKWDTFVKVMKDMGFTYVPSTAGSSVRFDPPDARDRSISFHKPHPDSFIHPKMLKVFSKKLRKYYGWISEDLD